MVFLELEQMKGSVGVFSYRPESRQSRKGYLTVSADGSNREIIKRSPDDDSPVTWYISHAWLEAIRMLAEEPPRSHGCTMWY